MKAHAGLSHANARSRHHDAKTRELIAPAVAVTLRCDGCSNDPADTAIQAGALKDKIVDVALMVNARATMVHSESTIAACDPKTADKS